MSRKLSAQLIMLLGVIVAVTGVIAQPIAQVNPTVSFWMVIAGLGSTAAAKALQSPGTLRRVRRAVKRDK